MDSKKKMVELEIDEELIASIKIMQDLLCKRLDVELPSQYENLQTIIDQSLLVYFDRMDWYYRLEGREWDTFYENHQGATNIPSRIEES